MHLAIYSSAHSISKLTPLTITVNIQCRVRRPLAGPAHGPCPTDRRARRLNGGVAVHRGTTLWFIGGEGLLHCPLWLGGTTIIVSSSLSVLQ